MPSQSSDEPYKPLVSAEYAEKLRKWQDNVHHEAKTRSVQDLIFLNRRFIVPPKVHAINPMSDLLGTSVLNEVRETDRVLDVGTGSGVNAILAASKSKEVIAIDINPAAIEAAKENARRNKVDAVIRFKVSDVFSAVEGKFDLIVFDPPFRWFAPRDIYEIGSTDRNYQSLRNFFSGVDRYLQEKGRVLLSFGTSGDIDFVLKLIIEAGFRKEVIAKRDLRKEGIDVSYFTFRLIRG